MNKIAILLLICSGLFSCATKKEILYFQDAEDLNLQEIKTSFEPIIEPNDILYITVSSIDEEVVKPFKRTIGTEGSPVTNNIQLQGYLVDADGNIRFPVLGTLAVMGKTRGTVEQELKAKLSEYITDVVVDVRIINFKITVIGEVKAPGVFRIEDERVTLTEAIALAGDFSEDGSRMEVTVIREENGVRKVSKIDYTSSDFFTSPFYFLKQNDIVYVAPSLKGVKKSGFIPDVPALLSLTTVILSTIILLTR
ncbi:polysaccharide biosynthesis/export family protein [Aequorivita todarodis]|uniref:polysaccharide biosynthesis/export family protein n=1 Tax=Aequorivita todarodis TaxID=2036821 RepID=UPI00234FDBE3|nr:polysaccharide biosynthesis/export family protein [Aequorivita todarodis]MDC8000262.1 polysaccharide biosynthesis/export family protein [Aequorivita todarodis]